MTLFQCVGWWEQEGYGRQQMSDLQLSFADGKVTGTGLDIVGPFRLDGFLEESRIALLKQYIGKHQIQYYGESIGEGAYSGNWSCYGLVGGRWLIGVGRTADAKADLAVDAREI